MAGPRRSRGRYLLGLTFASQSVSKSPRIDVTSRTANRPDGSFSFPIRSSRVKGQHPASLRSVFKLRPTNLSEIGFSKADLLSKGSKLKNERGQISISAVILLPLVLLIVGGILILGLALALEAKATTACRLRMAQGQTTVGRALAELTKLNPKAKALEATRQAALKALKGSIVVPNPAARAAAIALLRSVELAQAPVRKQQLYWVAKGKQASSMVAHHAKEGVLESIPEGLRPWFRSTRIHTRAPRFRLVISSPTHKTPTYLPAPDFQNSQNGVLKWKNALGNPNTQNSALGDLIPEIEFGCSMTLEPVGAGQWAPQPTEDKLSSNSSS